MERLEKSSPRMSPRWFRNLSPRLRAPPPQSPQHPEGPCLSERKHNKISARNTPEGGSTSTFQTASPEAQSNARVPRVQEQPGRPQPQVVGSQAAGSRLSSSSGAAVRFASPGPQTPPRIPRSGPSPEPRQPRGDELRRTLQELMEQQMRSDTLKLTIQELLDKQTASILESIHSNGLKTPSEALSRPLTPREVEEDACDMTRSAFSNEYHSKPEATISNVSKAFGTGSHGGATTQMWRDRVQHLRQAAASSSLTRGTAQWMADWLQKRLDWWDNLPEEPPSRGGNIEAIVRSEAFGVFCGLVIAVHTGFVVAQSEYLIQNYMSGLSGTFLWAEVAFTIFYVVELMMRIMTSGFYFFVGNRMAWNVFDLFIVVISVLSLFFDSSFGRLSFLRSLRILRVVMMARILRLVRFMGVGSLHLMVKCMLGTLTTLGWCMVLLSFTTFIFSVFFVQALADGLNQWEAEGNPVSDELMAEVLDLFGTVGTGMLTLVMTITGGKDWEEVYGPLRVAGLTARSVFVFYILFAYIALWNVITSIFVEKALYYAKPDSEARIFKARREELERARELRELFTAMDIDCSKTVSFREFAEFLGNPEFYAFLQDRGIDPENAHTFFDMLLDRHAEDDDQLDIDALVSGCLHIQGVASGMDMQLVRYELKDMKRQIHAALAVGNGSVRRVSKASNNGKRTSEEDVVEEHHHHHQHHKPSQMPARFAKAGN